MIMNVGVYGLGRFGYFWSKVLAQKNIVKVYSRNQSRETPENTIRVSEDELCSCDIIFLCVAISAVEKVLEQIKDKIGDNTIIADTCSVKMYPVEQMKKILKPGTPILATHPMFGPDSARKGVQGLPIVLSNIRLTDEQFSYWDEHFQSYGMDIYKMTPEEHDREAAYTQGVTHFIGRVLSDLELKSSGIGTAGYNDLLDIITQTCNDPWQLFMDLQRYNPYTKDMRDNLAKSLKKVMNSLEESIDK